MVRLKRGHKYDMAGKQSAFPISRQAALSIETTVELVHIFHALLFLSTERHGTGFTGRRVEGVQIHHFARFGVDSHDGTAAVAPGSAVFS